MCYCLVTKNIDYEDNNNDDDDDKAVDDDNDNDDDDAEFNLTISEPAGNAVCGQSCKMSDQHTRAYLSTKKYGRSAPPS